MRTAETKDAESPFSVLIVDSDSGFTKLSCELIAQRGHRAWGARDLIAAVSFLHDQTPDLLMVEMALLEMDGADPLGDLRSHAPEAPVVITNGGPPDERFKKFSGAHDIFGYLDKAHGGEGLLLWLDSALSVVRQLEDMRQTRHQLRQVLEAVPELHQIQSLDQVLEAILLRIHALLGGQKSFVAARLSDPVGRPPIEGFKVSPNSIADYVIGAGSLDYPPGNQVDQLKSVPQSELLRAIDECRGIIEEKYGVLPLSLGEHILGLAYLDHPHSKKHDEDVVQLFTHQAAAAIRNAALYEMATIDSTTRVFRKAFALDRLRESLKLGWRKAFPVTVLMTDIDQFKELNDEHGHVVGDRALRYMGRVLKRAVRDSDIVGRFGGDEFIVVLVDANREGSAIVAERLYSAIMDGNAPRPESVPPMKVSIGMASLEPDERAPIDYGFPDFEKVVETLVERADLAMYKARREDSRMCTGPVLGWADFARPKP